MASIMTDGLLSAAPAAEPWPRNEPGEDSALGLQADEMFAPRLDTEFAGEVRGLVHDPVTGLAGKDPEEATRPICARWAPPRRASCATRANERAGTRAGPIGRCGPA